MKKRTYGLVGLGLGLVLFVFAASARASVPYPYVGFDSGEAAGLASALPVSTERENVMLSHSRGQPEPAGELSAPVDTSLFLSLPEGGPADRLPAQAAMEWSCPLTTMTSPVWWDTPPQSSSVIMLSSGQEFIQPGPDDEVRVIIQLKDEPTVCTK